MFGLHDNVRRYNGQSSLYTITKQDYSMKTEKCT